jgi:hypothetical protein
MAKSMFSREVALKLEAQINAFEACRGLSQRARDINIDRKGNDEEMASEEGQPNSSASAMLEFAEGRIALGRGEIEAE